MQTKYQFILISSPPSKEAAFQQAKEKHGSIFAFQYVLLILSKACLHKLYRYPFSSGSNIENWHSILRKGLINASGTKYQVGEITIRYNMFIIVSAVLQLHGAAYGKGIYLSPLSSISFGYTGYNIHTGKPKVSSVSLGVCLHYEVYACVSAS